MYIWSQNRGQVEFKTMPAQFQGADINIPEIVLEYSWLFQMPRELSILNTEIF